MLCNNLWICRIAENRYIWAVLHSLMNFTFTHQFGFSFGNFWNIIKFISVCIMTLNIFFLISGHQYRVDLQFCKCEMESVTLVRYRLWPSSPEAPRIAFDFELMELAVGLQLEVHLSLKAFCDAIIQSQNGFPVMVRPDEVISSYRTRLTGICIMIIMIFSVLLSVLFYCILSDKEKMNLIISKIKIEFYMYILNRLFNACII